MKCGCGVAMGAFEKEHYGTCGYCHAQSVAIKEDYEKALKEEMARTALAEKMAKKEEAKRLLEEKRQRVRDRMNRLIGKTISGTRIEEWYGDDVVTTLHLEFTDDTGVDLTAEYNDDHGERYAELEVYLYE